MKGKQGGGEGEEMAVWIRNRTKTGKAFLVLSRLVCWSWEFVSYQSIGLGLYGLLGGGLVVVGYGYECLDQIGRIGTLYSSLWNMLYRRIDQDYA